MSLHTKGVGTKIYNSFPNIEVGYVIQSLNYK